MVLRITVMNSSILVEAIQAIAVAGSPMVVLIWRPDYLGVQSMLTEKLRPGQNLSTLLKLGPDSFSSYESTDRYFNAVVEIVDLQAVFFTAQNFDPVEFSQSYEDNEVNDLGYLHARFNRPVGAYMEDYISLKIYGICPEDMLQAADISVDPSLDPLLPLAGIQARTFSKAIAIMETVASAVHITVTGEEVFFAPVGRDFKPLILDPEHGVHYTRDDVQDEPVQFEINLPFLNIHPGAKLSSMVFLHKRTENVVLLWCKLGKTRYLLRGEIIYYLY